MRLLAVCAVLGGWLCIGIGGCTRAKVDGPGDGAPEDQPSYAELRDRVNARSERLVRLWQGALLVQHAVPDLADAFIATRIKGGRGMHYGAMKIALDCAALLERSAPVEFLSPAA